MPATGSENKQDLQEKKGTPPVSKQAAYSKAASHFDEAIETILVVMRTSLNPSDRLGAAKIIVNKVVPDLKATEMDDTTRELFAIVLSSVKKSE